MKNIPIKLLITGIIGLGTISGSVSASDAQCQNAVNRLLPQLQQISNQPSQCETGRAMERFFNQLTRTIAQNCQGQPDLEQSLAMYRSKAKEGRALADAVCGR